MNGPAVFPAVTRPRASSSQRFDPWPCRGVAGCLNKPVTHTQAEDVPLIHAPRWDAAPKPRGVRGAMQVARPRKVSVEIRGDLFLRVPSGVGGFSETWSSISLGLPVDQV